MSTVDIQVLRERADGSRICGLGVPLTPTGSSGNLLNMAPLIAVLDSRLEDLLGFTTGAPGVDEVQTVAITGGPTNGAFQLTIPGIGGPTTPIPFNATVGQVETALAGIPGVTVADVRVTLLGTTYTVNFQNNLGDQPIALMTSTNTFNKGGVTITEQTAGAAPGAGITARTTMDPSGGLLLHVQDVGGNQWSYRVFPAVNVDSPMITFLGALTEGQPNAWPSDPNVYAATEVEWREATVKYQVPKGAPDPTSLRGMSVVSKGKQK